MKPHLDLTNNGIFGDEGAAQAARALDTNTTLTHLDLKHNTIGTELAKIIKTALAPPLLFPLFRLLLFHYVVRQPVCTKRGTDTDRSTSGRLQ